MSTIMEFFSNSATTFVTAIVTVLVLSWLRIRARYTSPTFLENEEGLIAPGKASAWFTVVVGLMLVIAGMMFSLFTQSFLFGLALILSGGAIAGFMSPSLTSTHDVRWNTVGVEGACSTFGPTLGRKRTMINWEEIVKTGKTITDYWYIESHDGRRIFWSYLYPGHGDFMDVVKRKCPDVQLH